MKAGLALIRGTEWGVIHSEKLTGLLGLAHVAQVEPTGAGTLDSPYTGMDLQKWRKLASQAVGPEPIIYNVGGQLLVRWGTKMTTLKDYFSDMTDFKVLLAEVMTTPNPGSVHGAFVDKDRDNPKIDADKMAPYHKKALRIDQLTDEMAAHRARQLLADSTTSCADCPEMASSFCSLFVAEAHRAPMTFLITLMLLDLIETRTTYGLGGGKRYTWLSLLSHSKKGKDGFTTIDIPGRSGPKEIPLAKHPMCGVNTVKLGNQITNWGVDNMVRDRVASIASIWLAHYLQKNYSSPTDTFCLLKTGVKTDIRGQTKKIASNKTLDRVLEEYCRTALGTRTANSTLQIGGTTITYRDFDGNVV